ncbi:MAG: hypothetical protein ABI867_24905 [Kofleriaceae bacterium]
MLVLVCLGSASAAGQSVFDHRLVTRRFTLGVHRSVACTDCHTAPGVKPAFTCETCHAAKSPHGTRFDAVGTCATCHPTSWRSIVYKHAKPVTQLPMDHDRLRCRSCHRGSGAAFEKLRGVATCTGCHAHAVVHADDSHPGGRYTEKQCVMCHTSHSPPPNPQRLFHGPASGFPLVAEHKSVACVDCHTRSATRFRRLDVPSRDCVTCHRDYHLGRHGTTCTPCHTSGTWVVPGAGNK